MDRIVEVGSNAPNVTPILKTFSWCPDSATLLALGPYATADTSELFAVSNFSAADQDATVNRIVEVVSGGAVVNHDVPGRY